MEIEILKNECHSGFHCEFFAGDSKFYADITDFPFGQPECMIFRVGKNGRINWNGVYKNKDVEVSENGLRSCVEDFVEGKL